VPNHGVSADPRPPSGADDVVAALAALADPERAAGTSAFFKTGPGEYAEGDVFLGITVPQQRVVARAHRDLPLDELRTLLRSPVHEHRFTALVVMVDRYRRGDAQERDAVHALYVDELDHVDNWDLVDVSAPDLMGEPTRSAGVAPLLALASSPSLWRRRVAMVACHADIRAGESERALAVAEVLAHDGHDLIQKAVGWMLREVGKRCGRDVLVAWLTEDGRYRTLPRTELRYAIEHFSPEDRARWRAGTYGPDSRS
jgi:3-methyladenine DNA glycosylase AlkD